MLSFNQHHHYFPTLILALILFYNNIIVAESYDDIMDDDNKCLGANIITRGSIRKPDGPQVTLFHFNNDIPSINDNHNNDDDDIPFMLYASVLSVSEGPYWSPALLPPGLSCLSYNDTITERLFPFKDSLNTALPTKFKLSNNISAIVLHSADVASATGMPLSRLISELAAKDDMTDVRQKYGCQRLLSYTQTEKGVTILAESCTLLSPMCELKYIKGPTQTCSLKHEKREIYGTGSHRELYTSLKGDEGGSTNIALEWLPAELFVDPDELYDNNMYGDTYPLTKVDIEVPSFMNYPLPVISDKYPIPVHTRYTRPDCQKPFENNKSIIDAQRCDGHYRAWITSPIWLVSNTSSSSSCAAEKNNIYNELNINSKIGGLNILFNNNTTLIPLCVIPSNPLDISIPSGDSNVREFILWCSGIIVIIGGIIVISSIIKYSPLKTD